MKNPINCCGNAARITIALILTGVFSTKVNAQDPHLTQFYANSLYLNPAMTGIHNCPRVGFTYRNQWPALSGTYMTYAASYQQRLHDLNGGLGLLVMQDDQASGTLKTTTVSGLYAQHVTLTNKWSFSVGVQGMFRQRFLDCNKLSFGDQIDPKMGFIHPTQEQCAARPSSMVDVSAGGLLYSKDLWLGAAMHHITEPIETFFTNENSRLARKFTLHGGANITPKDSHHEKDLAISPNILYMRQGRYEELNLGLYVRKKVLVAGVWYRTDDAFITMLGLETKNMRIGYSYDFTVSELSMATGGSHEISLNYSIPCKKKRPRFRTLSCPSF